MARKPIEVKQYEFHALTPDRWDDFEQLFGPNGACAGCWCMWFRFSHREFSKTRKEEHKEAMRTIVQSGFEPGVLAYADGIPAGWVALAPREWYERLKTSRQLALVDDQPVWSITCFFIHRNYRRSGMMEKLVHAAVEHARSKGAKIVEAYPLEVEGKMNSTQMYTGKSSVFYKQGFEQAALRDDRPIVRKYL